MNNAIPASSPRAAARFDWQSVRPWLRDGFLLLALTQALVAIDASAAIPQLWQSIPLAFFAVALTLIGPHGRPLQWHHLINMVLLSIPLIARAIVSMMGPLPEAGFRETMDLGVMLVLGLALWYVAGGEGHRAVAIWTIALGIGWLAELTLGLFDRLSETSGSGRFTLGLGFFMGMLILALARWRHGTYELPPAESRPTVFVRLTLLALGIVLGAWWSFLPTDLPIERELPLIAGRYAIQDLWLQSILTGWGRHAIGPLSAVLAQPHEATFYTWGGIWALLATGGLLGVAFLIALVWLLLRRRARHLVPSPGIDPVPDGTVTAALLLGGLILGGGPLSSVTLLVFAGWMALAFARPQRLRRPRLDWNSASVAATAATAVCGLLLLLLLGLPLRGNALHRRAHDTSLTALQQESLLRRAEAFNPFDPNIPLQLADVLRRQMNDTQGWSEALYSRVIEAYRRAESLNPYQTMIPLRLAQFQLLCKREDDAIATIRRAQERQPFDADLCEWLFSTSLRLGREEEATWALGRGLEMAPMDWRWWMRQFQMTSSRGQVILARQSLGVALTASPGEPRLLTEAWNSWGGGALKAPTQAPAVVMPDSK